MPAKMLFITMVVILVLLYILSGKFRKHEEKGLKLERFFFKKLQEENASLKKIQDEVLKYGKDLGIEEDKILSLIRKSSI